MEYMNENNFSIRENEVLSQIINTLRDNLVFSRIILFGSRAKGKSQKGSDFDICVDSGTPDFNLKQLILDKIEMISGLYSVDILYLNEVDDDFKDIILTTGLIVYES
jgi:uncharacterized protein